MKRSYKISILAFLVAATLFGAGRESLAASNSELSTIIPGLRVDGFEETTILQGILTTYQILQSGDIASLPKIVDPEDINFLFVSKSGALKNNRIEREAVDMFDDPVVDRLTNTDAKNDICYVQTLVVRGKNRIILAIHNLQDANTESNFQCLTVALWEFRGFDTRDLDTMNWQAELARIFAP